ncbi:MAG: phospholipid carrier-dependent glycosyltransferase, partial [Planctomycetota bacterium]
GLLVFFWARKMYGNAAGLFALFLFAFSPNFIAHGRLANTDVPISFFMLLSLFCFDRALRRLTPLSAALAGVTLGMALLAKFSGLLMLPVFLIIAFIRLVDGSSMEVRFRKSFTVGMWRRKLPVMLVLFAVMIAITYGAVWAGYGFRYSAFLGGEEKPLPRFASVTSREEDRPGAVFRLIHDNGLLPQAYLEGFHCVRQTMHRFSFLDGRDNWDPVKRWYRPWPHYFIMTSLYKTAGPALLFFVVAVVLARRMSRRTWKQETPLAVLFVVYFVVAMSSNMNIGHRHILPVIPLAIIFLSKIVNHIQGPKKSGTIVRSVIFGVLLVWCAYGTVSVYPNYLAYFNEIAGGPANGAEHLTDSNIDWGQDLILLKRYADNHGIKKMHLCYFGTGDPFYYKIPCKLLESIKDIYRHPIEINLSNYSEKIAMGDYVAVSVTHLMDTYPQGPEVKPILRHVRKEWTPVAKIGYSIYLYRAEKEFDVKAAREKIIRMLDYKKRDEYLLLRRLGIEPGN